MSKRPLRHALIFALITLALSWAYEAYLIAHGGAQCFGPLGLIALMWIPGAVSLAYRSIARLGFSDIGFRAARVPFFIGAIGLPLLLALLTNLIGIPLGMKIINVVALGHMKARAGIIVGSLVLGIVGAIGEEIGWRGFLLPKLIEAKTWNPYILSGIIWALWHAPLVSLGGYYAVDAPLLIALVYSFSIITSGYVIGLFRVRSGSIWVAIAFHASHNFFFQLAIPYLFFASKSEDPSFKWWELIGADCGVVVGALYLLVLGFMIRGQRLHLDERSKSDSRKVELETDDDSRQMKKASEEV